MVVLVWGVPSEPPVRMVADALYATGADVVAVAPTAVDVQVDLGLDSTGNLDGALEVGTRCIPWSDLTGAYLRPVEPELAPAFRRVTAGDPGLRHARQVHDALIAYTEEAARTGRRIANPLSAMGSNVSKPYQAQLIARHGFDVPDTLVTDDAAEALDFAARHHRVVYKSTSGIRSIVTVFDPSADHDRLARLRWCPVQFQEQIDGPDVRVHVVGDEVFPAVVTSTATDYRYAMAQVGTDARLTRYDLPSEWADRCVALAADLRLPFAGIDLKLSPDGRVVCFEANPSPGFPWYETEADLPISAAVARWLAA